MKPVGDLRLGIAGCGWVTRVCYAPHFRLDTAAGFRICAIYDPEPDAVAACRPAIGAEEVRDLPALAEASDAILIATPNATHVELIEHAIDLNRHVLVEKPVCVSRADWSCAAVKAERKELVIKTAAACRLRADVRWLLTRVDRVGGLRRIRLLWRRRNGAPGRLWHLTAAGGWTGVLPDLGYHLIDIAGAALGYPRVEPVIVLAESRTADGSAAAGWYGGSAGLRCEVPHDVRLEARVGACAIVIDVSWSGEQDGDRTEVDMMGENGSLRLTGLFGCSTDPAVDAVACRHFSRGGALVESTSFPIGPDLHIAAFAEVLREFRDDIALSRRARRADEIAFASSFMERANAAIAATRAGLTSIDPTWRARELQT
jgi:oxidoreductase